MISGVYFGLLNFVVKNKEKSLLNSISFSPNFKNFTPARDTKFFSKIGSKVGSNSSSTDSNNTGLPYLIAFSKGFKNAPAPSFIFKTFNSFSSLFLIHCKACNYGSIHKGHLLAFVVKIPFWTESSSLGKPWLAHSEISTSVVNNSSNLNPSLCGISNSPNFSVQSPYTIFYRKKKSKGPV